MNREKRKQFRIWNRFSMKISDLIGLLKAKNNLRKLIGDTKYSHCINFSSSFWNFGNGWGICLTHLHKEVRTGVSPFCKMVLRFENLASF